MLSFVSSFKLLKESFRDLMPIILVIIFFQLAIIQSVPENWLATSIGLAIVGVTTSTVTVPLVAAHGMGLDEMDNFHRRLHADSTDANLVFITPTKNVDYIIKNIVKDLDITGDGDGITYSYPITHLKELTLKLSDI